MSREEMIREFGIEIVLDDEAYWASLGYAIDYTTNKLVKKEN